MQKVWKRMPQWLRDTLMFILIMGCAVAVCELLSVCYDDNNPFATSVFILAVVLVSRFTTGYWPGILASAVGVVSVNYLFTYPFHEFNLTIDGYPLTFAVMLVVSVLVSTLRRRSSGRSSCVTRRKETVCAPISCAACRTISARR